MFEFERPRDFGKERQVTNQKDELAYLNFCYPSFLEFNYIITIDMHLGFLFITNEK